MSVDPWIARQIPATPKWRGELVKGERVFPVQDLYFAALHVVRGAKIIRAESGEPGARGQIFLAQMSAVANGEWRERSAVVNLSEYLDALRAVRNALEQATGAVKRKWGA